MLLRILAARLCSLDQDKSSVIRQKGESQNGCFKKTKHAKFYENYEKRTFLPPDMHTYVCVSGGKKCPFFRKFDVLCFLETPVLRFVLLPYYRRNDNLTWFPFLIRLIFFFSCYHQKEMFPSLLFTISHSSYAMNVSAIKVITFLPVFQRILSQHLIFSFPVPLILQSNCLHNYRFSLRLSPIASKKHITVSMMLVSSTFTPHTIHEPNPNIMKQNQISSNEALEGPSFRMFSLTVLFLA